MKEIDMETAAEIMNAKIKVEMKARQRIEKERRWEVRQQEEKIVYDPYSNILNFEKRRVTDMATCRRVYPPPPLPSDKTIVSKNMTDTREYIKTVCDRKGIPKAQNILEEEVGLQSLERRVSRGEVVIMPTDKSKKIQSTMSSKEKKCEESRGKRISVKVRVVEKGGTSLKQKLVRRDISFRQN